MTDKLAPITAQAPGQTRSRLNLNTGEVWYSPNAVKEHIAEARRELLTAIEDPQWVILDGMNAQELAAYDHGGHAALEAVTRILDGPYTGARRVPVTWEDVRKWLVALVDADDISTKREIEALMLWNAAWNALPTDMRREFWEADNPMLDAVSSLLVQLEHSESGASAAEEALQEVMADPRIAKAEDLERQEAIWSAERQAQLDAAMMAPSEPVPAPTTAAASNRRFFEDLERQEVVSEAERQAQPPTETAKNTFQFAFAPHTPQPGDGCRPVEPMNERRVRDIVRDALAPNPLVALTDEQILDTEHAALKIWADGHVPIWNPKIVVARAVIAVHCRINGQTEPKP